MPPTRPVKFVGRTSGASETTISPPRPNGEPIAIVVQRDEVIEVDPKYATQVLLRNPGAADDSGAEWIPVPRVEV